jgi:predicted permease
MSVGVILDRRLHVDKKSISRTAIYVLQPCLVFSSLSQSTTDIGQMWRMILYVLSVTAVMVLVGLAVGHLLRWPSKKIDALVLAIAFLNAGNMGLSVILFAFGEAGVELATAFFVTSNLTCNTLAPFFAARGQGGSLKALGKVFRLPGIYAFGLAMAMRYLGWAVPEVLLKPISLIGRAAVPLMLMTLGLQLSQTRLSGQYGRVALGVVLRLVVGALVAMGLAPVLGLSGLARSVAIVEASTPTAVSSTMMAVEFDADAEYVTSVIFASTLLSSLTLAIVISLVG